MRTTLTVTVLAGVLISAVALGVAAQQKPAGSAGATPSVSVYKSPT